MIFVPVGRSGHVVCLSARAKVNEKNSSSRLLSSPHKHSYPRYRNFAGAVAARPSVNRFQSAAGRGPGAGGGTRRHRQRWARRERARPEPERPGIGPRPVRGQHRGAQPPTACREQRLPRRLQYTQAHRSLSVHACIGPSYKRSVLGATPVTCPDPAPALPPPTAPPMPMALLIRPWTLAQRVGWQARVASQSSAPPPPPSTQPYAP